MDHLDQNLNDIPEFLVRSHNFFMEIIDILKTYRCIRQVKIIKKKKRFIRYLLCGAEIYADVDREKLKGLKTRIKFLADNVKQF